MIKFFRQSYAIQYVVIALMAIALWGPAFVTGGPLSGHNNATTPLFNLVNTILDFSPLAQRIFAFLLLILETLIFNTMLVKNQIVGKVSTMGAFVFVLLMSLTGAQTNFYPFALSTVFILLVINNIFDAYQLPNPEINLLKAGVFAALASMCYFPSIVLIIWMIVALALAKKGSIRFQLIPILGFLFVYFFYFTVLFLFGDLKSVLLGYRDYFASFTLSISGFNFRTLVLLALLVIPTLLMLFAGNNAGFEKTVAVRTKMFMVYVMTAFAVFLLFLGGNVLHNGLIFIVLSIVISYVFSYLSNTRWADLFLVLFMLLVIANQYYFKWL